MVDEPLEREPKHHTVNLSSTVPTPGTTVLPVSEGANRWLPILISLVGGLLIGAMFGMAAWISATDNQTGYVIAFALTGGICTFLPLCIVKLVLRWTDAPLRTADPQEHSQHQANA